MFNEVDMQTTGNTIHKPVKKYGPTSNETKRLRIILIAVYD